MKGKPVIPPVNFTATYKFDNSDDLIDVVQNRNGYLYSRNDHQKIKSVYYPGLPSHPDHEVARRQMSGFGGMLSFEVNGDFDRTKQFMDTITPASRSP